MDMEKGYDTLVSEFEKSLITKALGETQGVKSKAAQVLNINRTTLIEKMKRLGLRLKFLFVIILTKRNKYQ